MNSYWPERKEFVILYSKELSFDVHTVKIQGNGNKFELFKLTYWPFLNAKRINFTDFISSGTSNPESDGIGGLRYELGSNSIKRLPINTSRFWIYGSKKSWFSTIDISFGSIQTI